jgi:two-component system, chemotaxis family, chemotaxis protein CheY
MTVLVVDDSSVMRMVIIKELKKIGSIGDSVMEAADGVEAVKMAAENTFDLILMDWNMPNMLGIDAVRAIRAAGNKTPIIMVTTEGERSNVVIAIQSGANDYLVKPFSLDDFRKKVSNLCGLPA